MSYIATPLVVSIHPLKENPVFSERATHVCIEDECGGPFITLKQFPDDPKEGELRLDMDELEEIVKVARKMVRHIEKLPDKWDFLSDKEK